MSIQQDQAGAGGHAATSDDLNTAQAEAELAAAARDRRVALVELRRVRRWFDEAAAESAGAEAQHVLARVDARIALLS